MSESELPKQIEKLVDHLRETKDVKLSLTEIASVTEVLIATMQSYFQSIDASIYRECRALSDYIGNARVEIAALTPKDAPDDKARIPRAGLELDAIVKSTEDATNTIMEAAEEIMGTDPENAEKYQSTVNDAVLRIFEACSFQDITGQRISKVVETLNYIESRVDDLKDLLGVTADDIDAARTEEEEKTGDERLLNGPALEGEGVDQSEVDALMQNQAAADDVEAAPASQDDPAPKTESDKKPEPEPEPEPKPVESEPSSPKIEAQAAEEKECVVDQDAGEEQKELPGKTSNQADIDALFN